MCIRDSGNLLFSTPKIGVESTIFRTFEIKIIMKDVYDNEHTIFITKVPQSSARLFNDAKIEIIFIRFLKNLA